VAFKTTAQNRVTRSVLRGLRSHSNPNFRFGIFGLLAAALTKKILQNCRAIILQNARGNFAPVVEAWHLQKVHHASRGAGSRVRATENHASNSRVDERACAHRAWFLRHVEIALGQPPISNGCLSLRQSEHFRVRSSILEQLNLIMSAANNFSCKDNNRADRNFTGFAGFLRPSQCFAHEILVVWRFEHQQSYKS